MHRPPLQGEAHASGKHFEALDGLRGIAILMVLFVHLIGDHPAFTPLERAMVKAANYGVWGVDLFFVLSGFLITGILLDSKSAPLYFRTFYVRRTLRIFPLYYATLFVLFVLLPFLGADLPAGLRDAAEHQGWLWSYASNIYLARSGSWSLPFVGHFWSLAVEEQFYLFWPVVVFAFSRQSLVRICVAAAVLALGLRIHLASAGASDVALITLTPCRLDALAVGALLALAVRSDGVARVGRAARPWLLVFPSAVLLLSLWNLTVGSQRELVVPLRGTFVALTFGALLAVSLVASRSAGLGRIPHARALRFLGKYSYGVYVFHGILAYALNDLGTVDRVASLLGSRPLAMVAQGTVGALVALLAAIVSYELFEKHFLLLKGVLAPARGRSRVLRHPEVLLPSRITKHYHEQ